mmetsp:Transcript_21572/g.32789  ORF Transcript_21572/g.32789 Transcript_21572/m.32789 type:complete len:338 (+) Transcript_21572:92-1105(+)
MLFRIATITLALFAPLASAETRATDAAYDYDHPELWKDMAGSACSGLKNSPIAVKDDGCTRYEDYAMNHGDCTFGHMEGVVTNNGVNLVYKDSNPDCTKPHFNIPGMEATYYHHNAHIHLSSEHTIDGRFFSAEMHMVHLNSGGTRAAVVGSMIEASAADDNAIFDIFLDNWKAARAGVECGDCAQVSSDKTRDSQVMHPYKMLDGNSYYHYDGGLTTPPCSEIVWWNLAATPMSISVRQMAEMTDIILNTKTLQEDGSCKKVTVASKHGSTSRPTQPLYGRHVDKICPSSMKGMKATAKEPSASESEDDDDESSASSFVVGVGATTVAAAIVGQMV